MCSHESLCETGLQKSPFENTCEHRTRMPSALCVQQLLACEWASNCKNGSCIKCQRTNVSAGKDQTNCLLQPSCPRVEHMKARGCNGARTRMAHRGHQAKPGPEFNSETVQEYFSLLPHVAAWPGSDPRTPSFSFFPPILQTTLSLPTSSANVGKVSPERESCKSQLYF